MKEQEGLLLKLCEVLIENGFKHFTIDKPWWKEAENRESALDINAHYSLIFSSEFAKFAWGEESIAVGGGVGSSWKFHLSQLAQSEDKLKYIDKTYMSNTF